MTDIEKYERWRKIATAMVEEKKTFLDNDVQKVFKNEQNVKINDIKHRKTKSLRLQAN